MPLRPQQAKQFSVATTKIRIGRRPRCRYDRCRRAIPHCSSDDAASIPKSGPEIKNRCTQQGVNGEILASILKSASRGFDSGGRAGADAPGGGISQCFCRRGCAAPAQKAATLNALPQRKEPSQRKNRRSENTPRSENNRRHEIIRRHEKPVPTLRS